MKMGMQIRRRAAASWLRKFAGEDSASQIAEAALVLPLAFMLLLGIFWFGRAFNIYATINQAAQAGARAGAAQTCATCGNANIITSQGPAVVTRVMRASHVDPGQIQAYAPALNFCSGTAAGNCTNTASSNNITMCNNVLISPPAVQPQVCGVSVSFQYPYQSWLPFTSLNMQQITLKVNVQTQGEY
jgi:Flp pilus assembly protein TadG